MKRLLLIFWSSLALAQVIGGGTITATVVTAGTAVKLNAARLLVNSFSVQLTSGTATFCVGGSTVVAAQGTGSCLTGTSTNVFYPVASGILYDLSKYYVDASANSTVVTINYNAQP